MKLTFYPYSSFEIEKGELTIIQTTNKKFYFDVINGLKNLDRLVLSQDDEKIDAKLSLVNLDDVVTDTEQTLKFKTKIKNDVLNNLNDDNRKRLFQLDAEMKEIFLGAAYLDDFPIQVDEDWDINKQYAYTGTKLLNVNHDNPYDIIKEVLNLYAKFDSKKLLVLKNLFNYLYSNQIESLVQMIKTLELNVLILDFSSEDYSTFLEECRYYCIDRDFVRWNSADR
ncbi:type II-A CRISPR-associated protein Csn2 [Fructilactobacillus sanfranciscensis]|uniref:type II-A CRISPR-associated protein Csn2 n=1 Tax=Fructilactobacillus sanfranciscensis TaxID=1625 RepID=UPI0037E00F4F